MIREKAWQMYCEETKGSPAAVDFPSQVPKAYWEDLMNRASKECQDMAKEFITVTEGMSGFFAVHMWLNEEEDFGPFWEPYDTGMGRYATHEEAMVEALAWSDETGIEYRA